MSTLERFARDRGYEIRKALYNGVPVREFVLTSEKVSDVYRLAADHAAAQQEIARLRAALESALNETNEGNVAAILESALK